MAKPQQDKGKPEIGPENQVQLYLHCRLCIKELPKGESPSSYSRTQAGWTARGLQVWCARHDVNVLNIDFEGQQHPACLDRLPALTEIPSKKEQH